MRTVKLRIAELLSVAGEALMTIEIGMLIAGGPPPAGNWLEPVKLAVHVTNCRFTEQVQGPCVAAIAPIDMFGSI